MYFNLGCEVQSGCLCQCLCRESEESRGEALAAEGAEVMGPDIVLQPIGCPLTHSGLNLMQWVNIIYFDSSLLLEN